MITFVSFKSLEATNSTPSKSYAEAILEALNETAEDKKKEAQELVNDDDWCEDDVGEAFLTHSCCKVFEDEDGLEDFDEKDELEWEP